MPDEITVGEVYRRFQDHEQRTALEHRSLDDRIVRTAAEAVQADVHDRIERERDRELGKLDRRVEELERRPVPTMTFGKWIALAGAITGFLTVVVAAWAVTKGAG